MRRRIATLACAFALTSATAASPDDYAVVFAIDAVADASANRIELTPEVYRWIQDRNLGDIEIFNADRHPVPFARIAIAPGATTHERHQALPALELPASADAGTAADLHLVIDRDTDGRLRRIAAGESKPASAPARDWLLDASGFAHPIDRLAFAWTSPSTGIVARWAVDASDDLVRWRDAGSGTVLMLDQDGTHLERREIALGGVQAKYLRLHRLDDGNAIVGLRVDAYAVEHDRTAPPQIWIAAESRPVAERPPNGVARFDYTLPAPLPVESARIELANDNALAPLTLLAHRSNENAAWMPIGRVTAFRLRESGEPLRNGDIEVSAATRLDAFRIESPTALAAAPQLALGYRPDSFVFLAEGKPPYVLAAGSAVARHPAYPIEPALASLRASLGKDWQPPLAKIGAARPSGGDAALHAPPAPFAWRHWLLWAVLVGGAVLIAVFALSLLRGAKPPA